MRIGTAFPVTSMDGKTEKMAFYTNTNGVFSRERKTPTNPNTPDQQKVRSFVRLASRNWDDLTVAQRDGWEQWAKQYAMEPESKVSASAMGLPTYVRANVTRQILGLGLVAAPPVEAPPSDLTGIMSGTAGDPNEFVLRLEHGIVQVGGLVVLARITPAMPTVACRPKPRDLRLVCGVGAESSAALVASGQTVTFGGARFAVADGQRFGFQARVVRTADGIASGPVFGEAIRMLA